MLEAVLMELSELTRNPHVHGDSTGCAFECRIRSKPFKLNWATLLDDPLELRRIVNKELARRMGTIS